MHPYRASGDLANVIEPDTRARDLRIHALLGVLVGLVLAYLVPIWIGCAYLLWTR